MSRKTEKVVPYGILTQFYFGLAEYHYTPKVKVA